MTRRRFVRDATNANAAAKSALNIPSRLPVELPLPLAPVLETEQPPDFGASATQYFASVAAVPASTELQLNPLGHAAVEQS